MTQVLYSVDGTMWHNAKALNWEPDPSVVKLVIGTPPEKGGGNEKPISLPLAVPADLASIYPKLTHLHLWQVCGPGVLPTLPSELKCLDVRSCADLRSLTNLPEDLETLILENLSEEFTALPEMKNHFPQMQELSLKGCKALDEKEIASLIRNSPSLRFLDLSETLVTQLTDAWPLSLVDIRLNGCRKLRRVPSKWPPRLRRVELRQATEVTALPALPSDVDFVDLAYTRSLRQLPTVAANSIDSNGRRRPGTLFLFQTGVSLEPDLYGEDDQTNVAERVLADQQASIEGRKADCELRLILLGDGRCGKSSLARCLTEGVGSFRRDERSTHGVRLWEKEIPFTPVDRLSPDDEQDGKALLHIWDFAGQDLYHSTHRLFLQSRAIFIICHNDHPDYPGADEETDIREHATIAREGDDVHRPLQYWRDQVESLGQIPGTDIRPPVLVVRTKADRWPNEVGKADEIHFSAASGLGLTEIVDWVEKQAAKLLGPWLARSLPICAVEVKNQLRPKIAENQRHYWQIEEDDKIVQSPHPRLAVEEFCAIVTGKCTGDYGENPSLLLERFHRSGFLYHEKVFLPNDVILDQRWALQGIYVFSSRQSRLQIREQLFDRNGQFTREQLASLCWKPAGYSDAAIDLFLAFMKSCGMCFEQMRAGESKSGQPVYAAPGFFPPRLKAVALFPILDDQSEGKQRYVVEKVTESEIRSIVARIGDNWSRSMYAWRWGCRFVSASTGAVCYLDWPRPERSDQYFHDLVVRFEGPEDQPFYVYVADVFRKLLSSPVLKGHSGIQGRHQAEDGLQNHYFSDADTEARNSDKPEPAGSTDRAWPEPVRSTAVGIKITFSYAGSDKVYGRIGDVPAAVAKMLDENLKKTRKGTVLSYQLVDEEERLRTFTENLAKGDLILLFLSKKYWQSEYCMPELMLIYKEKPRGRMLDKRVLTYVIDNARLSRAGSWPHSKFENYWLAKATERDKKAAADADGNLRRKTTLLKRDRIVHDWYEFLIDDLEFEPFLQALLDYRLTKSLSTPTTDNEMQSSAETIFHFVNSLLNDPAHLLANAEHKCSAGEVEDAVWLLQQALAMQPDFNRNMTEFLSGAGHIAISADLRKAALKQLTSEDAE